MGGTMSSPVRFSEDVKQVSELKTRGAEIIDQVRRTRRPVLLTRRGRGVAVLMDVEEYESLVEHRDFLEAVAEGVQAAAAGDLHPHEEAIAILETFGDGSD
jgi:prevent-host-death family protein